MSSRNPVDCVIHKHTAFPVPIPVVARSNVGRRPLAYWDCGLESCRRHGCLSLVSVVCYQVQFSATGRSFVQRSPTECDVCVCDLETWIMTWPRPEYGCCATGRKWKLWAHNHFRKIKSEHTQFTFHQTEVKILMPLFSVFLQMRCDLK
jgi:hypothetical protein